MAGKAKKVTKGIRAELAELKRKQRERMKAAGETPQSLRKKRDRRRAEAARPRTSKASRTTPDGETTVPKRPGKDLVVSKPRQLPATIKPANKAVAIRKTFDIKPNVKNSKIEEITKGATSRTQRMSRLKKAGLLAAGGATVAAIGVGTGGKKTPTATASTNKSDKKSGTSKTKTTTEVTGKKRRVGTFAPRFRPFGGKIARALLGEDEQFGGEKGGLLDPNLGLGLRRSGRKIVTKKEGTAEFANIEGYEIAGKTGTAQKSINGVYVNTKVNTFASIFPASSPKFVFIVLLDEPKANQEYVYNFRDGTNFKYKGNFRNTAGWTTVEVAGKIIEKIGPILATKY